MDYPKKEGKYGPIFTVAQGITVMQTKYGTWQLYLYQKGVRKRRNYDSGAEGFMKAIRAAETLTRKLGLAGKPDEPKVLFFSKVADDWLESNRGRWASGTYERYFQQLRDFVVPALGSMPIQEVSRIQVKDFLADVLKEKAPKTVELMHAVVSGIFQEAIDRGYIRENPASKLLKRLLPPKNKRNLSFPDPFSKDELKLVIETAHQHLPRSFALVIEILAHTGLRLGECLAMHVDNIDLINRQYMVSETVKRQRYGLPKTGRRLIDLSDNLAVKVERYITGIRKAAMAEGRHVGYLFPGMTDRHIQDAMERVCSLAKVRRRHPHDLRHTFASLLLMAHVSPSYVMRQLGHHSIRMTCDTYGHWIPGEGRDRLNQALADSEPRTGAAPTLKLVR
jgi:integrase